MHIDIITTVKDLMELRKDWEAVYDADPEAHVFVSHMWIMGWFRKIAGSPVVLAAKTAPDAKSYVAFFPLRRRVRGPTREGLYNHLAVACSRHGVYTGALCHEDYAIPAMRTFAETIRDIAWRDFYCDFFRISDARKEAFIDGFGEGSFSVHVIEELINDGQTDLRICPFIELPETWEDYLTAYTASKFRWGIRRVLREIENSHELRITHSDNSNFKQHRELLLDLWKARWRNSYDNIDAVVNFQRKMLTHCFQGSRLLLPVVWLGDRVIGACSLLLDSEKRALRCFSIARDESISRPSPDMILAVDTIKYAIDHKYRIYDFMVGNYPYKYKYGAKDETLVSLAIVRKQPRKQDFALAPSDVPSALARTNALRRSGQIKAADACYRQILEVDPACTGALQGLGQIQAARGDDVAAERRFRAILAIEPRYRDAQLQLALALEAQDKFAEAAEICRAVIARQPEDATAHFRLGVVYYRGDQFNDSVAAINQALAQQPNFPQAEIIRARALHRLGRLSAEDCERFAAMSLRLGDTLGKQMQGKRGIEASTGYFRHAIALWPNFADAHVKLARALGALGERDGAVHIIHKALLLQPNHDEAQALLSELERTS